jgi:hypothetical protein
MQLQKRLNLCILTELIYNINLVGKEYWVATQTATPRHMSRLLRLLPSGSGRVHRVSLRGDRKGHHKDFKSQLAVKAHWIMANHINRCKHK